MNHNEDLVENSNQEIKNSNVEAEGSAEANVETIINFSFEDLKKAGMHLGHKSERTNRKMMSYIYGIKDGMHIIDLSKTIPLFKKALNAIRKCASNSKYGKILFVGTREQSKSAVKEAATQCGQYYINEKWLGGLLTNWHTVSKSIKGLKQTEKQIEEGYFDSYKKHERVKIQKKYEKQRKLFEGIREMNSLPNMVVVTSCHESTAIKEAQKLNIPVVLLLDTDGDPKKIQYPVPGNDDSMVSVHIFCTLCSRAGLLGIHDEQELIKKKEEAKKQSEENKTENQNEEEPKSE